VDPFPRYSIVIMREADSGLLAIIPDHYPKPALNGRRDEDNRG
jgi:hypothetical protein